MIKFLRKQLLTRAQKWVDRLGSGELKSQISDGYHTFEELYAFRLLYNAALFNEWAKQGKYNVHKSIRHNDGELCFGGNWFVVVAELPTGQITNHYPISCWDIFQIQDFPQVLVAYDGHTSDDVCLRLRKFCLPLEESA